MMLMGSQKWKLSEKTIAAEDKSDTEKLTLTLEQWNYKPCWQVVGQQRHNVTRNAKSEKWVTVRMNSNCSSDSGWHRVLDVSIVVEACFQKARNQGVGRYKDVKKDSKGIQAAQLVNKNKNPREEIEKLQPQLQAHQRSRNRK